MKEIIHKIKDINRKFPALLNKDKSWNIVCNTKSKNIEAHREWEGVNCIKCLEKKNGL